MQHDFGDASGKEHANGRMVPGAVGQDIHDAGHAAIHCGPVQPPLDAVVRPHGRWPGGEGAGWWTRQMQHARPWHCEWISRSTAVPWCAFLSPGAVAPGPTGEPCPARSPVPRGPAPECGRASPSASSHNLRRGGRSQKLTAAARRSAGPAQSLGGILQGGFSVGKAGSDGLDGARILSLGRRQSNPSGNQDAGQISG